MNHYDRLGVPRDADKEAILKAYRAKAKGLHPDVLRTQTHLSEDERKRKEAEMVAVNEAYATLEDDESRADYDAVTGAMDGLLAAFERVVLRSVDEPRAVRSNILHELHVELGCTFHAVHRSRYQTQLRVDGLRAMLGCIRRRDGTAEPNPFAERLALILEMQERELLVLNAQLGQLQWMQNELQHYECVYARPSQPPKLAASALGGAI